MIVSAALGVALGLLSAVHAYEYAAMAGSVQEGRWRTNEEIGSADADMRLRAAICSHCSNACRSYDRPKMPGVSL
ncbi:MAG: hypothetical protein KJO95_06375 [Gammaproteobacteria bacterium]|nr:hypothetical protein [Gammaproteobacteria bacterium]MBU2676745.1 hypothetical protein [Gammaproteobacteria bacterium]NNC57837.1 hypothetical protein [Woeseiaceae bacterium]NNL50480.1 hypothetical protein [Woeseiaceae bacterium]